MTCPIQTAISSTLLVLLTSSIQKTPAISDRAVSEPFKHIYLYRSMADRQRLDYSVEMSLRYPLSSGPSNPLDDSALAYYRSAASTPQRRDSVSPASSPQPVDSVSPAYSLQSVDSGYASISDNPSLVRKPYEWTVHSDRIEDLKPERLIVSSWGVPLPTTQEASWPLTATDFSTPARVYDGRFVQRSQDQQDYKSSVPAKEASLDDYTPPDRSSTYSPLRDPYSPSSSRASPQSDSSEDTSIASTENDPWLTVAYAKHRVMVSLMRDVYEIFNSRWRVGFRSQTGSESASPDAYSQSSSSPKRSSPNSGKRKAQDEDSHSPDDNREKKRTRISLKDWENRQKRFFACCFYKYNAQKYCSNSSTGTKYRSCAGPGFSKISQLK